MHLNRRHFLKAGAQASVYEAVASPNRTGVASAFTNREFYFGLANDGRTAVEVATRQAYAPIGVAGVSAAKKWNFAVRSLPISQVKPV